MIFAFPPHSQMPPLACGCLIGPVSAISIETLPASLATGARAERIQKREAEAIRMHPAVDPAARVGDETPVPSELHRNRRVRDELMRRVLVNLRIRDHLTVGVVRIRIDFAQRIAAARRSGLICACAATIGAAEVPVIRIDSRQRSRESGIACDKRIEVREVEAIDDQRDILRAAERRLPLAARSRAAR